jgi:hypothetical protein
MNNGLNNGYMDLIDARLIVGAEQKVAVAKIRLSLVVAEHEVAAAEHAAAKAAEDEAVAGNGSGDPQLLAAAAAAAASRLDVARRVVMGAETAVQEAVTNVATARSIALRPVYVAGVELRLSAAKKSDEAKAMLAEAAKDYATATGILNLAVANGCQGVVFDNSHNHTLTTHAAEVKRWSGETTHRAWWRGLDSDGNVIEPVKSEG